MSKKEHGNKFKFNLGINLNVELPLRKILMKMNPTDILFAVAILLYFLGLRFI